MCAKLRVHSVPFEWKAKAGRAYLVGWQDSSFIQSSVRIHLDSSKFCATLGVESVCVQRRATLSLYTTLAEYTHDIVID